MTLIFIATLAVVGCGGTTAVSTSRTIVHPRIGYGGAKATEYLLPNPNLPPRIAETLKPWMADVARSDIGGIRRILEKRWSGLESKALISLRDQLLSYEPASLIECDGIVRLRLRDPNVDSDIIGGSAYVLAPFLDEDARRAKLRQHGIAPDSVFAEFLLNFGGLAEDFDTSGNFIQFTDDWEKFSEDWQAEIEGFDKWRGSLQIYHGRNGDTVLLRSDGSVGWWVFAEHRIQHQANDFDEFIRYYVNYRRTPYPLDSYGPSD